MPKFIVTETINAPFDEVNDVLDNFANTYVYHPFVEHSRTLNDQERGAGARRECKLYNGQTVQEVQTEARPGHWVIDVNGMGPMKAMRATINATDKGVGKTELSYNIEVQMKFPFQIMGPMVKMQMSGMMRKIAKGVEQHVNSGRLVEKNSKLGQLVATSSAAV